MIQEAEGDVRLCYLDFSPIWDAYLPERGSIRTVHPLSVPKIKFFMRHCLDHLIFRVQLFRSGIHYSSLGRRAVKRALKQQQEKTKDQSYAALLSSEINGVPIAKILFHDVALFLKVHDIYSLDQGRSQTIREMAVALLALHELLVDSDCFSNGSRFFAHEGYSLNSLVKLISREAGGELVFFTAASHKNVSLDMVEFTSNTLPSRRRKKCQYWQNHIGDIPLTRSLLEESFRDIETRLLRGGSHIYSPSLNHEHLVLSPHAMLSIPQHLPIVTVFTSSLDEFVATQNLQEIFSQPLPAEPQAFDDQIEMLRFLATEANKKRDHCLVIRHHPRLGATKDEVQSQYYEKLCSELAEMHSDYVRVVMPESPVSSYWLIAWSSCVVNAWSNIGLEGLRLGVPTINVFSEYKSVCYWPQALFPKVDTPELLSQLIQEAIDSVSPSSAEKARLILAHSFYCFMNVSNYINLEPAKCLSDVPVLGIQSLRQAICDPDSWEAESFEALSNQVSSESREPVAASEIASELIRLFMEKLPLMTIEETLCPLLSRLAKYQFSAINQEEPLIGHS